MVHHEHDHSEEAGRHDYPREAGARPDTAVDERRESSDRTARMLTIAAFVLAALALFFAPLIVGALGILLGWLGSRRGDPLGRTAMWTALATTVIGIIIAFVVWNAALAIAG